MSWRLRALVPAICAAQALAFVVPAAQAAPPPALGFISPSGDVDTYVGRLKSGGERDRVLNQMEIGARTFWAGDYDQATVALDDAIHNVEAVFAGDANSAKARSLWYEEGQKIFKGEPYERVMLYYYRGLLFLRAGDYENARAAFKAGQLQDAFAEEDQYRCDFAAMVFLEAWASHLNHDYDLRDEALARLKQLRPDFAGIGPHDDTLVLAETGTAPRKLGDGLEHAFFVYRRGKGFTEARAAIVRDGASIQLFPMEDIYLQAVTRGGRQVDKILRGKAEFAETTSAIGSTLTDASSLLGQASALTRGSSASSSLGTAGAVVGGIGAVSVLISLNAKPEADTRTWSSLPDTVHVTTYSSQDHPDKTITVRFLAQDGAPAEDDKSVALAKDTHGASYAWVRSR